MVMRTAIAVILAGICSSNSWAQDFSNGGAHIAQNFAISMCNSYRGMIVDLSGRDGEFSVPPGVIRTAFDEYEDLQMRELLSRSLRLMLDRPNAGQRYLQGSGFMNDCVPVAMAQYDRASLPATSQPDSLRQAPGNFERQQTLNPKPSELPAGALRRR